MKTVVFQSYRTKGVARWTQACLESTRAWARSRGFDYRFFDDAFLDLAPAWYREKCAGEICPLTDLARLVAARDLIAAGYERTVWVDADILVFAPAELHVDIAGGFAFCLELWAMQGERGELRIEQRINNSVSVFTAGNAQLAFLIDACLRIAQGRERLHKLDVGTRFLSGLSAVMPVPVLPNVGTLSPLLMHELACGEERAVREYARHLPRPIAAANLCGSLVGQALEGAQAGEPDYDNVVSLLTRTAGGAVNRHLGR